MPFASPLQRMWRFSWLITAPAAITMLAWALPVARDTVQFTVYHPGALHRSSDVDLHLRQMLLSRLLTIRADFVSSWRGRWSDAPAALPILDLRVSKPDLARLNANLPRSGKEAWVPADFQAAEVRYDNADVRYRGDSLHHWGFAAKSWLIRTPSSRPWQGHRRWHVVLPRWRAVGSYYVNLRLAARMGLLTADPQIVSLRVNGRQHGGVHLLLPDQDETFLRRHARLPGDLYVGDLTQFDDGYVNEERGGHGLWEVPWLWQKTAVNNQFPPDSHLPLEILFHRLYAGTAAELAELLDLPAWARFAAYMQLFAANHMDMGHNWKLYYDFGKLRFEPVLGDGNGLPDDALSQVAGVPGMDLSVTTPLLARLHQDHSFLRLKNEALASFFQAGLDRVFFEELERFIALVSPTLEVFPQLDWIGTTDGRPLHYFDARQLRARADRTTPALRRWFEMQREQLTLLSSSQVRAALPAPDTVRVQVDGYGSIRMRFRGLSRPGVAPVTLTMYLADGTRRSFDVTSKVKETPDGLLLDLPLLAQRLITTPTVAAPRGRHEVAATTYDLRIAGAKLPLDHLEAQGLFGEVVKPQLVPSLGVAAFTGTNVGIVPESDTSTRWEGLVELDSLTEINGLLTVAPGTRIRLGPGASVVVRGAIDARGTNDAPIVVERRDPARPWGTIVIIGTGQERSYLSHCRVSGGSGWVSPYALFSGMISVRHVKAIEITQCHFADNTGFDDQLHVLYSTVHVADSVFHAAAGDAIDLDISEGMFERVRVTAPKNDCLDLMTSRAVIIASTFEYAGDKGVSVGEGSTAVVLNTRMERNAIGLQSKDGSVAVLYNSALLGNGQQLSAYHKNLSYPGSARIDIAKSVIDNAGNGFSLEDGSTARVFDTAVPTRRPMAGLEIDALSDSSNRANSTGRAPVFEELLPGPYWRFVNDTIRGISSASGSAGG